MKVASTMTYVEQWQWFLHLKERENKFFGKSHGYGPYTMGCRCSICTQAQRDYQRAYRARKKAEAAK